MIFRQLCIIFLLFISQKVLAQTSVSTIRHFSASAFEFQAYPTGLIPGLRFSVSAGAKGEASIRLGYQWIRHGDAGVQEEERGEGGGLTLGYRYYFDVSRNKWFAGVRNDFWYNILDWKDQIGTSLEMKGSSKVFVLQPTLEGGYLKEWNNGWFLVPSLALGFEVNVVTQGAETGQGAIFLLGIALGKRIYGTK